MLIVLLDEPGLFVFPSVLAAEREIEPIDAAAEIRAAFDESGVPYGVQWLRPPEHTTLLGFGMQDAGEYRLVPVGPPAPARLLELLDAHPRAVEPESAEADLALLRARLRGLAGRAREPDEPPASGIISPELAAGAASPEPSNTAVVIGGPPDRVVVTLAIYGMHLDPDELTRRLAAPPTESHQIGELFGRQRIPRRTGAWMISAERAAPEGVQECLDELCERLPAADDLWRSLAAEYDVELRIAVFFDALNRGFDVSAAALARLAVFRASLVVDLYAG